MDSTNKQCKHFGSVTDDPLHKTITCDECGEVFDRYYYDNYIYPNRKSPTNDIAMKEDVDVTQEMIRDAIDYANNPGSEEWEEQFDEIVPDIEETVAHTASQKIDIRNYQSRKEHLKYFIRSTIAHHVDKAVQENTELVAKSTYDYVFELVETQSGVVGGGTLVHDFIKNLKQFEFDDEDRENIRLTIEEKKGQQ